jgi:hypothetical protein
MFIIRGSVAHSSSGASPERGTGNGATHSRLLPIVHLGAAAQKKTERKPGYEFSFSHPDAPSRKKVSVYLSQRLSGLSSKQTPRFARKLPS